MDFMTMMQTRRSCRSYLDKAVSREDLIKIVEAGRLSPSGCNSQPWRFVVIDEAEAKEKLYDALVVENGATGSPWRFQVPAFVLLVEQKANVKPIVVEHYKDTQRFAQGDIGAACMNMCHQAMDLGLDTCILGVTWQKKMEELFGIPEGVQVRMLIAVGYGDPAAPVQKKVRKPLEEVCSFNHW
jgi:nitroreductase